MIHRISLAEVLCQSSPPARVLNIGALDDTVFVTISEVDRDHQSERHRDVAEISVSLPALIEALTLLCTDQERERLRPVDQAARSHETRLAGRRLTITPVAPWSAVAALTDHVRYAPEPGKREGTGKPQDADGDLPDPGHWLAWLARP